ncbi:MAG TPA: hypothetical protein VFK24_02295 [Gammaproteobacteria bacterium]|nr:hypothetical protein [Gammaproteobacteria bacterium]
MLKESILPPALIGLLILAPTAFGHGFSGKRFFPATLNIEDSFVAPELDFLFTHNREDGAYASDLQAEFAKPLTDDFQLSIGADYAHLDPQFAPPVKGFGNFDVGAKYQVFINGASESALAVGVEAEIGGTGNATIVGPESHSVVSPAVYYSKGFGNLSTGWLRPFAITAQLAPSFPVNSSEPRTLEWGFTVQYNLPYLESFVKDTGMPAPFRNMIPIIEFPMETCLEGDCRGQTTGTINPGIIWVGKVSQLAFELVIPVNDRSGSHIGFQLQYHLYLDDIFPSWGR